MIKKPNTNAQRLKRHKRVRAKISGTAERPRLNVFRSEKNIYAQVIDDVAGVTLCSASSLKLDGSGGNKTAADLAGIHVNVTIMRTLAIGGMMTAMGALMLVSRVTNASPTVGLGYDNDAILSVVVGGTSLAGGKGNVLGTMLGVLLVTLLSNCMNLLGVSNHMQYVMKGAVLIFAIWADNRKNLQSN